MGSTFQALLDVTDKLGQNTPGTATGGSITTLVDSSKGDYPDDYFNGGTLFILSGDNALSTLQVTDFATTTGTFTFAEITKAIVAGVEYAIVPAFYPRSDLVRSLNSALNEIGPLPRYEIHTPSTVDQESYLLSGVFNIKRVETTDQDAEPYNWELNYYWREVNNRLVFTSGNIPTFTKLRIWYEANHARVKDDNDYVNDYIHPNRLAATAAKYAILTRLGNNRNNEPNLAEQLKEIREEVQQLALYYPIKRLAPTPHLSDW